MFDLLVKGGQIVDGSGQPAYTGDIAVRNGKISVIGELAFVDAAQVIDAGGLIVTPGFIDVHTHSDFSPFADPRAESQIRQGVTTEVTGQCGVSLAPCTEETRSGTFAKLGYPDMGDWQRYAELLELMDNVGNATNHVGMVGHGALREMTMGLNAPRPATDDEVAGMVKLLEQALEEGAFGFTTGLEYHPGKMAAHDEIVALCRAVAKVDGCYATHSRNRDIRYLVGFGEAIDAARESGVRLQISHINPKYGRPEHAMRNTIEMIDWAREEGLDVAMDMMPSNWNHASAVALMPAWSYGLDQQEFLRLLKTEAGRERLQVNPLPIWQLAVEKRWEMLRLLGTPGSSPYLGMTIAAIAEDMKTTGWDAIFNLMMAAEEAYAAVILIGKAFAEEDNRLVLQHPLCAVASDTMALANDGVTKGQQLGLYGYNWTSRFISHYLRDENVLRLEEGIRRLTSLPASRVGLKDRGSLTVGSAADMTVFDLEKVRDNTQFNNPTLYAGGFEYVIVNGVPALVKGERTPDHAGRILRRQ
jgi:N-acyl-D-amino-acid deacylase